MKPQPQSSSTNAAPSIEQYQSDLKAGYRALKRGDLTKARRRFDQLNQDLDSCGKAHSSMELVELELKTLVGGIATAEQQKDFTLTDQLKKQFHKRLASTTQSENPAKQLDQLNALAEQLFLMKGYWGATEVARFVHDTAVNDTENRFQEALLRARNSLGTLYLQQGRHADGEYLLRLNSESYRSVTPSTAPLVATSSISLGEMLRLKYRFETSRLHLMRGYELRQRYCQHQPEQILFALRNLCRLELVSWRFSHVITLADDADELVKRCHVDASHPAVVECAIAQAEAVLRMGDFTKAQTLLSQIVIDDQTANPELLTLKVRQFRLQSHCELKLDRIHAAKRFLKQAESLIGSLALPAEQQNVMVSVYEWQKARILIAEKEYAEAQVLLEKGLKTIQRVLGRKHLYTIELLLDLAHVHQGQLSRRRCGTSLEGALITSEDCVGVKHPIRLLIFAHMMTLCSQDHRFKIGKHFCHEAYQLQQLRECEDEAWGQVQAAQVQLYLARKKWKLAEWFLKPLRQNVDQVLENDHPQQKLLRHFEMKIAIETDNFNRWKQLWEEQIDVLCQHHTTGHPEVIEARLKYAQGLHQIHQNNDAWSQLQHIHTDWSAERIMQLEQEALLEVAAKIAAARGDKELSETLTQRAHLINSREQNVLSDLLD